MHARGFPSRSGACSVAILGAATLAFSGGPAAAVTLSLGDIVITDYVNSGGVRGRVLKIDPTTGAQTTITENGELDNPWSLAVEASRTLVVADMASGSNAAQVLRINPADGGQTVLSSGGLITVPTGLCIGNAGQIYVANNLGSGTGSVLRIDPTTGAQTTVVESGSLGGIWGLAADTAGYLYANVYANPSPTSPGGMAVMRIDPTLGGLQVVSSTSAARWYTGIAVATTGTIYSTEIYYNSGILEINPTTGSQTFIWQGTVSNDPWGVAMDLSDNVVVADGIWGGGGAVYRLDRVTHAQTMISSGGLLVEPRGVAVVPEPGAFWLAATAVPGAIAWFARRRRPTRHAT